MAARAHHEASRSKGDLGPTLTSAYYLGVSVGVLPIHRFYGPLEFCEKSAPVR